MPSINHICQPNKSLKLHRSRLFSIFFLFITLTPLFAQSEAEIEYELKAYFIYTFTKYIDWGDLEKESTFVIGFIGESPIIPPLEKIALRNLVKNKKLIIKRWIRPEDIGKCDILFIAGSKKRDLARIIKIVEGNSTLTIGDTESFSKRGVVINLIGRGDRIGFEINIGAAELNRLKVSSQLQKLAVKVYNRPRRG